MYSFAASLPENWPHHVRSAVLHVISLAQSAITCNRSLCADSPISRVRLTGKVEYTENKYSLLREEVRIKDTRVAKIPPRNRPFYPPTERMAILELKAAQGWNLAQTAKIFMVEPETIADWMKRLEETGVKALVQVNAPVNKFPAFVRYIAKRLKVFCPVMGKKRIAEVLTRAGLVLSATTIARILKSSDFAPEIDKPADNSAMCSDSYHTVTARHPNHIWHVDLTVVPTKAGFWIPWFPWSVPQVWPFAYWVAVVIDHFSRKVMGFVVFKKQPSSLDIRSFMGRAIRFTGQSPRYLISDRGSQFDCEAFKKWCKRKKIKQRYGAIGKYGSIAVIERFIRSMKHEYTNRIIMPLNMAEMRYELGLYITWYNAYRPHQSLNGRTPADLYGTKPQAPPMTKGVSNSELPELKLEITWLEGRRELPIIEIRKAA